MTSNIMKSLDRDHQRMNLYYPSLGLLGMAPISVLFELGLVILCGKFIKMFGYIYQQTDILIRLISLLYCGCFFVGSRHKFQDRSCIDATRRILWNAGHGQ